MKKHNLQNKLFDSGLIEDGNSDAIKNFKKAYRADYTQKYNREFREKTKRKTLIFTPEELTYLQEQADKHQLKLSPFLKAVIFAYLNASFVFPDRETLSDIEGSLREINRRVAESIQYIHLSREIKTSDIEEIKLTIAELKKSVSQSLNNPPRLEIWLKNRMKYDELFLPKLLQTISNYLTPNQ